MNFLEARKVDGLGEKCRFRHVSQDLYSHQRLLHGVQADPKKTKFPVYWPGEIFFTLFRTLLHFCTFFPFFTFQVFLLSSVNIRNTISFYLSMVWWHHRWNRLLECLLYIC